jgi:hypothetical protein
MAYDYALRFVTTVAARAIGHGVLPSAITHRPTVMAEVTPIRGLFVATRALLLSTKDLPKVWRHREQRRSMRSL